MSSKKDYEAVAKAISDGQFINCATVAELDMNRWTRRKIADQIADYLQRDNPAFNRARFLNACGFRG